MFLPSPHLSGDVVTPGFFEDHLSTDVITGLPHDSAEGYMFDFAINLQTMKYLQATNALTTEAATKAMDYMKDSEFVESFLVSLQFQLSL